MTLRFISTQIFACVVFLLGVSIAQADENKWRHGDALIGELKYAPDFKHYEHVNPDAPKAVRFNCPPFGASGFTCS